MGYFSSYTYYTYDTYDTGYKIKYRIPTSEEYDALTLDLNHFYDLIKELEIKIEIDDGNTKKSLVQEEMEV